MFKENEEEKMKLTTLTTILIGLGIIVIIILAFYLELKDAYFCDIGLNETAGDFEVEPISVFNNHQCAVEDCVAFNNYQKEIKGNERCVV